MGSDSGVCWLCELPATLVCPRCTVAQYCSTECAENDLAEHQEECEEAPSAERPCAYCGRLQRHLSYCPRCHLVAYCSASCRQLDARLHLPACLAGRDAILRVANRLTHGATQFRLPCYFGDGPRALNLLKGLDLSGEEPFRLLQLSAQLHHLLRSAAAAAGSRRPLAVTLASDSPHQLARACLLLKLITSGAPPAPVIQIFYSLRLETAAAQLLHASLEQLVSATYSQLLQLLPWLQLQRATLSHCQEVWRAWLHAMQDSGCLQRMLACRGAALQSEPTRSQLQSYLAALPGRQQRDARQLLLQHGCLQIGEVVQAAAAANVTLLALNPRYKQHREQLSDLQLGAQPPDWLDTAGDALTIYAPAPPAGPLADWDALEVRRAVGDSVDIITGCRLVAEDCAAALAERAAGGRLSVRLVQFETLDQLDDQLSGLQFERIFTADTTDRLGLYAVLEMCELLLSSAPRALILTCHQRWAALSPPAGTTVSALRGGGSLAWDRQMDTERFRLTAYLQAARLAYTAAARDKDVLDNGLPLPTKLEVVTFGTLLLTDPTCGQPTVAPYRQRRAPRPASVSDPSLRLLEWRRDTDGVRRMQAEVRVQQADEVAAVTPVGAEQPSPQHRGPGQYERQVQHPRPARLNSPLYGSLRRSTRRPPPMDTRQLTSPQQQPRSPTLYENLTTTAHSTRPPPTPVPRAATLPRSLSLRRQRRSPTATVHEPLYETLTAVVPGQMSLPSPPNIDPLTFRRTASLRDTRRRAPQPRPRLLSVTNMRKATQPPTQSPFNSPPHTRNNQHLSDQPRSSSKAIPQPQTPSSGGLLSPEFTSAGLSEVDGVRPLSPAVSPHADALQTPEGRRRLVQRFTFPTKGRQETIYGTMPRRSASLSAPIRPVRAGNVADVNGNVISPIPLGRTRVSSEGRIRSTTQARTPTLSEEQKPELNSSRSIPGSVSSSRGFIPAAEISSMDEDQVDSSREGLQDRESSVKSPADIDRMTQRRQPKNIADWLREDTDRQREYQREALSSSGHWSRHETPLSPSPAAAGSPAASEVAPTRPGRITPVSSAISSSAARSRRSQVLAGMGRSSERLLASLEREWSLEVPEPEPETIGELGARGVVAEWLLDRLLRDELRQLAVGWIEEGSARQLQETTSTAESVRDCGQPKSGQATSSKDPTQNGKQAKSCEAEHNDETTQNTKVEQNGKPVRDSQSEQAANNQQNTLLEQAETLDGTNIHEKFDSKPKKPNPSTKNSLAPSVTAVETPAPRPELRSPFDINAQEVGRLESPRFAEVDTPAPRTMTRDQFFRDMQQYKSPVTGKPLVTMEPSDNHSTSTNDPLYSSSVYIPSPEQRIIIPIPTEAPRTQPPAIRVPVTGGLDGSFTSGSKLMQTPPQAPESCLTDGADVQHSAEPDLLGKPSSPLQCVSDPDDRGSRDQSAPAPVVDMAADQGKNPAQTPEGRSQLLRERRARLMARAALNGCEVATCTSVPTNDTSAPVPLPRAGPDGNEQTKTTASGGSERKADSRHGGPAVELAEGTSPNTNQTKYTASATIVPSPSARTSPGKQMLWKIPLLEKCGTSSHEISEVIPEGNVNSSLMQTNEEAQSPVELRKTPSIKTTRRASLRLSMDKEFYEMKKKLSKADGTSSVRVTAERRRSRPLSMEAEYREMRLKLHPPGQGASPSSPATPLLRTGSVRERATLFSQGKTPHQTPETDRSKTSPARAQVTVTLKKSPSPRRELIGPLAHGINNGTYDEMAESPSSLAVVHPGC